MRIWKWKPCWLSDVCYLVLSNNVIASGFTAKQSSDIKKTGTGVDCFTDEPSLAMTKAFLKVIYVEKHHYP